MAGSSECKPGTDFLERGLVNSINRCEALSANVPPGSRDRPLVTILSSLQRYLYLPELAGTVCPANLH